MSSLYTIEKNKYNKDVAVPTVRLEKEHFNACVGIPGIKYHGYAPKGFLYTSEAALQRLALVLEHGIDAANGIIAKKDSRPSHIDVPKITANGDPLDSDQQAVVNHVYKILTKILKSGNDSLLKDIFVAIDAYPGTGKTTLLVVIAKMLATALPDIPILMVSFTNTAVNEFADRMENFPNVHISTIHKIAYDCVKKYFGNSWRVSASVNETTSLQNMLNSEQSVKDHNERKLNYVMKFNNLHTYVSKKYKTTFVKQKYLNLYTNIVTLFQGYDITNTDYKRAMEIILLHKDSLFTYFVPDKSEDDDYDSMEVTEDGAINYSHFASTALDILKLSDEFYKTKYPSFNNEYAPKEWVLWRTSEYCRVATKIIPEALTLNQYKIILLDEYQDSNISQHNFVKRLQSLCDSGIIAIGNFVQAIYTYSGCLNGSSLKDLYNDPKSAKFTLTHNKRSSLNVVEDWCSVLGLTPGKDIICTKPKINTSLIRQNVEYDEVIELAGEKDAILLHINKDVFAVSLALIEKGKYISLKNTKFYDNFRDLVKPIQESKKNKVGDIKKYYEDQIEEYTSWGAEKYENKIAECERTLTLITKFLKTIKLSDNDSVTKLFAYIDSCIRPDGITVSTVHTSKGCEYNNVFCDSINRFNLSHQEPIFAEDEKCKKLVMLSRAKYLNYYFDLNKKVILSEAIQKSKEIEVDIEIVVVKPKESRKKNKDITSSKVDEYNTDFSYDF